MGPERWEKVQEVYARASELAGEERRRYLDEACADDAELRAEVERMLAQGEGPDDFLLTPNPVVSGRRVAAFELRRELGRGGMGVVYEARDTRLDRTVALKILPRGLQTTQNQIDRFRREARSAARLKHPSVVPIYEVGEDATQGLHYFSMEHVAGGDLAGELRKQRSGDPSQLPAPGHSRHVQSVARCIAEVAEALQHSHDHGVVHRDIKPQNLLLGDGGRLRLVDFGLAKDESQGSLSKTGEVAGTPHYMSPEQAAAKRSAIDHRTDIYSLGVVLYEMLTLERPYEGRSNLEVMTEISTAEPRSVRKVNDHIPRDLDTICAKAMAREPRERYRTAREFGEDLRRLLALEAIAARPPSLARRVTRELAAHRARYLGLALFLVGVLATSWIMSARARSLQIATMLTACEPLEEADNWIEVPLHRRVMLGEQLQNLAARDDLSAEQRARVVRLQARWDTHLSELVEEANRRIRLGFSQPRGIEMFDDEMVVSGEELMVEAAALYGPQAKERGMNVLDATRTVLSVVATDVQGGALAGEVMLRELDPIYGLPGELERLGPLPLEGHRLPAGYYRIIVIPEGSPHREFTRLVERGDVALRVACVVNDRDPLAGTVAVQGGEMRLPGEFGDSVTPYTGIPIQVASFHVDEAPVSVGEYMEFVRATGRGRPAFWQHLVGLEGDPWSELEAGLHDDLPMVGVSWFEARDFAEWAGKRLISAPERDFVGRGPAGRLYPYEVAPGEDPYRGAVDGARLGQLTTVIDGERVLDLVGMARHYLQNASPVRSFPEARSQPHGLFHLLGNAEEFTETLGVDVDESGYFWIEDSRVGMGASWTARLDGPTLEARALIGAGPAHAGITYGFRCARSFRP